MSDGSETTYRFGGDAAGLLAELGRVRKALDDTGNQAKATGQSIKTSAAPPTNAAQAFVNSLRAQTAELGKTRAELLSQKAAQLGVTDQTKAYIAQIAEASKHTHKFGFATAQSKRELLVLGHELSQGSYKQFGGSLLVLAEQTGAAGLLFSAMGAAVLAGAAALGLFALAVYKGHAESEALNKSLQITNNYAGLTQDSFRSMGAAISAIKGESIGRVNDALQAVVATGRFTGASISGVTKVILDLERLTGQSAGDIVKDFSKMSDGVAKWAAEHNKQYHFITAADYDYIKALEAQGKTQEAVAFTAAKLDAQLKKAETNLGTLEKAWKTLKTAASDAWDAMLNIGREATLGDKLKSAQETLDYARKALSYQQNTGGVDTPQKQARIQQEKENVARYESLVEGLRKAASGKEAAAEQQGKADVKNEEEIAKRTASSQGNQSSLYLAGIKNRLALAEYEREQRQIALDRGYAEGKTSLRDYIEQEYALRRAALQDKLKLIDAEGKAERTKKPGSPDEVIAQNAKALEIASKRYAVLGDIAKLEEQRRLGDLQPKKLVTAEVSTPNQDFRRFERGQDAQVEKDFTARKEAGEKAAHDLIEINEKTTASLVKDQRTRGLALIKLEEDQLREKLDLGSQGADDRKRIEDDLATWRVNRETQLTEQLKPQWQKQLEGWKDHNRLMRESYDEFQNGWIDAGQRGWVEFIKTGKVNLKTLTDFAIEEGAKLQYKSFIGDGFSKAGDAVAGLFGIKKPAGGADTAGSTARQTAVVEQSTLSFGLLRQAADSVAAAFARVSGASGGDSSLFGSIAKAFTGTGGSTTGTVGNGAGGVGFAAPGGTAPLALGGAFVGGEKTAFAKGGAFTNKVFSTPTAFRFGQGARFAGVMGEAGDEAVMPLKRGPNGSLGVASHGGGKSPVNVIVNTPPGVVVEKQESKDGPDGQQVEVWLKMAEQRVAGNISRGQGPVVSAMNKRGINTDRNLPRRG